MQMLKKLKLILILCPSLVLVSCQNFPAKNRKLITVQCTPILQYETVEILRDDLPSAEIIVDERKSVCRCKRYKYSLDFMGPIANSSNDMPLSACDRLIGNQPASYNDVVNFLGDLRRDLQDAKW